MSVVGSRLAERYLHFHRQQHSNIHAWERCYSRLAPELGIDDDIAALELGFYLASWGMFRGSSKLRNYSHTALIPVISEVRAEKWLHLRGIRFIDAPKLADEIFELMQAIRRSLAEATDASPTDTLVSKIALGALGCIPAYDRLLIDGLIKKEWPPAMKSQSFIVMIGKIEDDDNFQEFAEIVSRDLEIPEGRIPDMRLADAYLNYLGDPLTWK